ncbi:MAG: flagellar basal body P-ring formation protein FlgA [Deltaproteobacteria bacterium]|nr:flagellar basal body P-ring formation protein FlgA [Deltaproteobacteria bacterium]
MTKLRIIQIIIFLALLLLGSSELKAEDFARPKVMVLPQASIQEDRILLGKIAQISYDQAEFKLVAEKLAGIDLGDAPYPMASKTIIGENILSAITAAGIKLESIGYSVPRTVSVERQGRQVGKSEVLQATRELFSKDDALDVLVREVQWNNNQVIPVGNTQIQVVRLGQTSNGKIPLRVDVLVNDTSAARFLATAIADDWREIPVPRRSVERGRLVQAEDIQLVRLNVNKEPEDIILNVANVVGYRAKGNLMAGEPIKSTNLDIPPVVTKGSAVTMVYKKDGLIASAQGQAIVDGHTGGLVQVKNVKSQKLVKAKVISADQVEVITE